MNKDKKRKFIALVISFVLIVFIHIFALQFIQEINNTIICLLIGMETFLFVISYTIAYIVPKAFLRVIEAKKKEKNLAKIKHI